MQKRIQKIIIPLIVILVPSLLAISAGLYVIGYYLLSNSSKDSLPVVTGDPLLKFDRHLGFIANTSAKTERSFAGGSYEVVTDSSGARISSPDEKTVNATTPIRSSAVRLPGTRSIERRNLFSYSSKPA